MRLRIGPDRLISEVQQDFNASFNFLKLQFFENCQPADKSNNGHVPRMIAPDKRLGDLCANMINCVLDIPELMRVCELEEIFQQQLGLKIQVFRRSGATWLYTSLTSNWTLANQNQHGKETSESYNNSFTDHTRTAN